MEICYWQNWAQINPVHRDERQMHKPNCYRYNPSNISLARNCSKRITWLNMPQLKPWNILKCVLWKTFGLKNMLGYLSIFDIISPLSATLSSSQFPVSFALGKLFSSRSIKCSRTNIQAYFRAKWRILSISYSTQCDNAQIWSCCTRYSSRVLNRYRATHGICIK